MKLYTGKSKCAGCGKTGDEQPRLNLSGLCNPCKDLIKKGRAAEAVSSIEFAHVFQHFHAFYHAEVNSIAHKFLEALNVPGVETSGAVVYLKHTFGSNGKRYAVDRRLIEPLRAMLLDLDASYTELSKAKEAIPKEVEAVIALERTRIYNEGIEQGRKLLLQLNTGKITIEQLNNNYSYCQK